MIDFQSLNNLPEINFKAKGNPDKTELARYIDHMKKQLFDESWSQATKKHIKKNTFYFDAFFSTFIIVSDIELISDNSNVG